MERKHINTVVFDLGGVLIDWNPRYLYRKLIADEAKIEWFLENICTAHWNEQQDAGRPIVEANQLLIERHPEHRALIEAYYGRWIEMVNGTYDGTVQLLSRIRAKGHRILYLSNWSAETFPLALERFEFLQWFEGGILSGKEKLIKPDPRVYELLVSRYAIDPETALYLDDRADNLRPAASLGMAVHHFATPESFEAALVDHGVLPNRAKK